MSFFKAYDMRGTYGVDFDLDVVYRIGRHLPAVIRQQNAESGVGSPSGAPLRVLIGRDARVSSPAVAGALIAGLEAAGAQVTDLGPATTPMVYFFTAEEDFGIIPVESQAAGRPVVVFGRGGGTETVIDGETGYCVECGDTAAVAERTLAILRDPVLAVKMGENGRAFVAERFRADRMGEILEREYLELVAAARKPTPGSTRR